MTKSLFDQKEEMRQVQSSVNKTLWEQVDALRKVKKHKWKDLIKALFKLYVLKKGNIEA